MPLKVPGVALFTANGCISRRAQALGLTLQNRPTEIENVHSRAKLEASKASDGCGIEATRRSPVHVPLVAKSGSYICPACERHHQRLSVLDRHLQKCCPDLVRPLGLSPVSLTTEEEWRQPSEPQALKIEEVLKEARQKELRLREAGLHISFHEENEDGQRIKRDIPEIAKRLGLPEERVSTLMRLAMRSIPLPADPGPLDVIHEDDALLVVNKPPGLVTAPKHRWMGGTLVNQAITHLGCPPFPIHRLDIDTSGVILLGKTSGAAGYIHKQLRKKTVQKCYLAIVFGTPHQSEFTVEAAISDHPIIFYARNCEVSGLPAVTDFKVLSHAAVDLWDGAVQSPLCNSLEESVCRSVSLVAAFPRTGRTHQIRLHLAHVGHPILGDKLYGAMVPLAQRQMLHACSLSFRHPSSKSSQTTYSAPPPDDFRAALEGYGLEFDDSSLGDLWPASDGVDADLAFLEL